MGLQFNSLEQTSMEQLTACFNQAFQNYFVPFQATDVYLRERWQAAGVDYQLSAGVFDGDCLAGFLIFGTGMRDKLKTAHNLATGVLPFYQGRRLVAALYDFSLPKLRAAGMHQSTLEVITQNQRALRAYQSVGYTVARRLHCFAKEWNDQDISCMDCSVVQQQDIDWQAITLLPPYKATWEQRREVLMARSEDYSFWTIRENGSLMAYAIVNPITGHVPSFSALPGKEAQYGLPLMAAVGRKVKCLRINNVDASEQAWLKVFDQLGLSNNIDQFELRLIL